MEDVEKVKGKNVFYIIKGLIITLIDTFILLLILSSLLVYTNLSENIINPTIIIITAVSILLGSSIANIKIKNKGIINGGIIGAIYMISIYLISSIMNQNFSLTLYSSIMIVTGVVFGMLGGIIGVNIGK